MTRCKLNYDRGWCRKEYYKHGGGQCENCGWNQVIQRERSRILRDWERNGCRTSGVAVPSHREDVPEEYFAKRKTNDDINPGETERGD